MSFEKNLELESYLKQINQILTPSEDSLLANIKVGDSGWPTVVKLGSPRSGGTLLTQWLQDSDVFQLPTNFMSRFYATPSVGSLIYKMMVEPKYDYRNELNFSEYIKQDYSSEIGKTVGFFSPHEFWYFWRHNLYLPDIPTSSEEFTLKSDFEHFAKSLEMMQKIFDRPLFLKGHLINFYLKPFSNYVENVLFLHQYRNPISTIRSLLKARKKWTGSYEKWFSHKPRQYRELVEMDFIHQATGQVYFIEKEVFDMADYLGARYYQISYEELCRHPEEKMNEVVRFLNKFSHQKAELSYTGESSFKISDTTDDELDPRIYAAWRYFEREYGEIKELKRDYDL